MWGGRPQGAVLSRWATEMKKQIQFMYVLWTMVLVAGALVWIGPTFLMVGAVHSESRTTLRVEELRTAPNDFQPSRKQYEDACADAQAIWHANYSGEKSVFFLSVSIVAVAIIGLIWTDRLGRSMGKRSPSLTNTLPHSKMEHVPNQQIQPIAGKPGSG